jgi:hypothetical protein
MDHEFGFADEDDFDDLGDLDDGDHECECEKAALMALMEGEPLIFAITQLMLGFGLEGIPADATPWKEFKQLYEPMCKVMMDSRSPEATEDKVRLLATFTAMMTLAKGPVAVRPDRLEKWLRRIRNVLVSYRDEE